MNNWLREHVAAIGTAMLQARHTRGSFALNMMVIAIALTLPFFGLTLMHNMQSMTQRLAVEPSVSVFVAADVSRQAAEAMAPRIGQILQSSGNKGRIAFVPREDALASLQERSGIADAVAVLGNNPLPDAYLLTLENPDTPAAATRVDAMVAELETLAGVELVQVDSAWIRRLAAILQVLRLTLVMLAVTLAVVVTVVVFNTIRLQMMTQQEEIDVARLLGATDRFLYRPFYYAGALLGSGAGLLALATVAVALYPLNQAIDALARSYGTTFFMTPLDWPQSMLLILLSALLGLTGSLLSMRRRRRHPASPV